MIYVSEYWAIDKTTKRKINVMKMRMLRWMSGVTREDSIRNEYNIIGSIEVAPIIDKMRENRLRWLGLVLRIEKTEAVSVTENMSVEEKRGR